MAQPQQRLAHVPFAQLAAATDDFSAARKLGEGLTSEVFRGDLDGAPVAVKRLKLAVGASPEAKAELARRFRAEANILGKYRHPRLVRLEGVAVATGDVTHPFALVFELLAAA